MNQLLVVASVDVDANDVLTIEALTAYKADEFGQPTPDIAVGFVSPVLVGDVLNGYEFTPLDDFFGDVVFTYTVSDSNGPGIRGQLNLTVNPIQDLPRLGNLGESGLNLGDTPEDTQFTFTADDLLAGYSDPDLTPLAIKADSVSSPYGDISFDGAIYTFTPFENFAGSTQIDYTILDDFGAEVVTAKYLNVTPVNDPPTITLNRDAAPEDYKSKSYVVPLVNLFADGIPTDPVVELSIDNDDIVLDVQDSNLLVTVPGDLVGNVSFAYGDGAVDPASLFELDVLRPLQVTEANAVLGFERFFTLSDFGFYDIEGLPLQSVLIQVSDPKLGSINLGPGRFSTDTSDVIQLTPISSVDYNSVSVVEVTREQIASGMVFFSSNPSPDNVGKSADFEFNVKDSSGDLSVIPGLIRVSILDAPSSVEDSIIDSKYQSIFESELGLNRFNATDVLIQNSGITQR